MKRKGLLLTKFIEISTKRESRWSRFEYYPQVINYLWPVPCFVAGYFNISILALLPAACLLLWMMPEFWYIRVRPRAVLQDRFDIPRKFTLIIVGLTALYILLGTFTFHTVGSVALAYSSDGQAGIPKEHILWYGMAIFASLHVWRYLRERVKPVCDALIVEAGKRRDEIIGQLRKSIDPRLLRTVYGKGRPN